MTEKSQDPKDGLAADWLLRGALSRLGDGFDRLTGRRWVPSSSLATSELIQRIKNLLDSEAKTVPGKGLVVPHNIQLKMQWDKFSTDSEDAVRELEDELLAATIDHINDSLYYTHAPMQLEVKPDYFVEGVKLLVSFDTFSDNREEAQMNVTLSAINLRDSSVEEFVPSKPSGETYIARFELKVIPREKRLGVKVGGRFSVGRTGTNDLVIDDISVSKLHASVFVHEDHGLSVADIGSTNGTFIGGNRIAYGKAIRLGADCRVKFGDIEVAFEYVPNSPNSTGPVMESEETINVAIPEFTNPPSDLVENKPAEPDLKLTENTLGSDRFEKEDMSSESNEPAQ
jgi:pSer/pThr/pTyr-binding forkhead associated (FHA) protein